MRWHNQPICHFVHFFQEPEGLEISQDENYEKESSENVSVMASVPTWFHCENSGSGNGRQKNVATYSPFHRNPVFAGGQFCAYTELLELSQHFHPTVTLFANNILKG
jgi:ribosome biogenesis protein MAK21